MMKRFYLFFFVALVFFSLQSSKTFAQGDSLLFFDTNRVAAMKNAIQVPGSTHQKAFAILKNRVDSAMGDTIAWGIYDGNAEDGNWNYARNFLAREASMMYLLTDSAKYAGLAYEVLYDIHNDPDPDNRIPEDGYGLARAMVGTGFAIAYKWCASAWDATQKSYIRDKINLALDEWSDYYHPNLTAEDKASNWVAVCRSAELMMILSMANDSMRTERYNQLNEWLLTHMQNAYGDKGVTQEGNGYLAYPGGFLFPAIFSAANSGDSTLYNEMKNHEFWKLLIYTSSFSHYDDHETYTYHTKANNFGTGSNTYNFEGFKNLLFNTVEGIDQDYYQYIYDRQEGVLSSKPDFYKYDQGRAGVLWLLAYYPESNTPVSPDGNLDKQLLDAQKGFAVFRNRWKDTNDISFTIMGDDEHFGYAWDQSEATQITLIANDQIFFSGPQKNRDAQYFSTIQIDQESDDLVDKTEGKLISFDKSETGGYAIVDGFKKYAQWGVNKVQRHAFVHYPENSRSALISIMDQVGDQDSHDYSWSLNLGDFSDDSLLTTTGNESGVPYFLMKGNDDAYVKGWVVHPNDAVITENDQYLRVTSANASTDTIWVVMAVDSVNPGAIQLNGSGMNTVVNVLDTSLVYSFVNNRLRLGSPDLDAPQHPSNLSVVSKDEHDIMLGWDENTEDDFAGYAVYRGSDQNFTVGEESLVKSNLVKNTFYDRSLPDTSTFFYRVFACDLWGNCSDSGSFIQVSTSLDRHAPQIRSVITEDSKTVVVLFDEALDAASASQSSYYAIDNKIEVFDAQVVSSRRVKLTTSDLSNQKPYRLSVEGVQDTSGNVIDQGRYFNYYDQFHIYEFFEGCDTGALTHQGSGQGWGSKWLYNDAKVIDVSDNPLSVGNIKGGDQALMVSPSDNGIVRYFDREIKTKDTDVYISFLIRLMDTGYAGGSSAGLYTLSADPDATFAGIYKDSLGKKVMLRKSSEVVKDIELPDNNTAQIVLHIREEGMRLWVNPQSEADVPALTHSERWNHLPGLGVFSEDSVARFLIDDIQLGQNFNAVAYNHQYPELTAPSHLRISPHRQDSLVLSWRDHSDIEDGFNIYREKAGGGFQLIGSVDEDSTIFVDDDNKEAAVYSYLVEAYNDSLVSPYSNIASVDVASYMPGAPDNLVAELIDTAKAELTWEDNSTDENGFIVYRKKNGGAFEVLDTLQPDIISIVDSGFVPEHYYTYKVHSFNDFSRSTSSPADSVIVLKKPENLMVQSVSPRKAEFNWEDHSDYEETYVLEWKKDNQSYTQLDVLSQDVTFYETTNPEEQATYVYRLFAKSQSGFSDYIYDTLNVPASPSNVTVNYQGADTLKVTWDTYSSSTDGLILQSQSNQSGFVTRDTINKDSSLFIDSNISGDHEYTYRLFSYLNNGLSGFSADSIYLPGDPTGCQAFVEGGHILVNWNDNASKESGYIIERRIYPDSFDSYDTLLPDETTYKDTLLTPDSIYQYRVYAFSPDAWSGYSTSDTTSYRVSGMQVPLAYDCRPEVYPNPTAGILHVKWRKDDCPDRSDFKMAVWNAKGELVYSGYVRSTIDLSELPAGIYTLRLFSDEENGYPSLSFVEQIIIK